MRTDLLWRLLLPVAATLTLTLGAPEAVSGGLALGGLVAAVDRMVLLRRGPLADRVLVDVGAAVAVLVLTGVGLDLLGVDLRPASWVLGLVVVALVALALSAVVPARATSATPTADVRGRRRAALLALPWLGLAVVVAVVAVRTSAGSLAATDEAPLEMSIGAVSGGQVEVVVDAEEAVGPLELRTSGDGAEVSYPLLSLDAGESSTTTLALPRTGRFVITLSRPDQTEPLRTLVLDR